MAKGALFVAWGQIIPGRGQKSIKVFNEAIEYYTNLLKQGEIDSFEPVFVDVFSGDFTGFFFLKADRDKLDRMKSSEAFIALHARAALVVSNVRVLDGTLGEGIKSRLANFAKNVAELD